MKAFIFDMDGVLVDNSDYHVQAWTAYGRHFGVELTVEEIKSRLGFNNRDYMRFILKREPTLDEVRASTVEKEALYRQLYREHLVAPPGLLDLLAFAKKVGIKCGVATSAPQENVDYVLDGLNIRTAFQQVVTAAHVKNSKPDPEIYLQAAAQLALPVTDCIVFEDAIAGIQSGNSAGMPVIAITSSYPATVLEEYKPAAIIASFTDLARPCRATELIKAITGHSLPAYISQS